MGSLALAEWRTTRGARLDQLVAAHTAVGGRRRGRRFATDQLNAVYLLAVAAQFQGFCRDLHSESATALVGATQPHWAAAILSAELTRGRWLDRGNPNPKNIKQDFERLGLDLWTEVTIIDRRSPNRKDRLAELMEWRNAIAHDDARKLTQLGRPQLPEVRRFRSACNGLARTMDAALGSHLGATIGQPPW